MLDYINLIKLIDLYSGNVIILCILLSAVQTLERVSLSATQVTIPGGMSLGTVGIILPRSFHVLQGLFYTYKTGWLQRECTRCVH